MVADAGELPLSVQGSPLNGVVDRCRPGTVRHPSGLLDRDARLTWRVFLNYEGETATDQTGPFPRAPRRSTHDLARSAQDRYAAVCVSVDMRPTG